MDNISADYKKWDVKKYLQEYYYDPLKNNSILKMEFINQMGSYIKKENAICIEIGSGPVICHLASLAPYVTKIFVADYLRENLDYIKSVLASNNSDLICHWEKYFLLSQQKNIVGVSDEKTKRLFTLLQQKIGGYLVCDIRLDNPLGSIEEKFDCVMSLSCSDSITSDKELWKKYMKNIFSLVKPGGLFIGEVSKESHRYWVGEVCYPVVWLKPEDCIELMRENDFISQNLTIKSTEEIILMGGFLSS